MLKVPLFTTLVNHGCNIELWRNKKCEILELPFSPYFYSEQKRDIPCLSYKSDNVRYIKDLKLRDVWKYKFASVKDVPMYRDENSMEADIPYIQRVCIDSPRYFYGYPQDKKVDVLHFDIEVDSIGKFPKPYSNPIIAISYSLNDDPPTVLEIKDLKDGDAHILKQFSSAVERLDPDVLCTYYGNRFDIPYIIDRCEINKLPTGFFTRDPDARDCFFLNDEKKKIIYIKGRVLFDIYDEVVKDQTLFGVADRSMKTVGKWFNLKDKINKRKGFEDYDIIIEDLSDTRSLIGTKRLNRYITSDVLLTQELYNIYFPNIVTMCNVTGIPLNIMVKRTASLIGTIYYARELKKLNIISDSPNFKRYPDIFGVPEEVIIRGRKKTKFVGGTKFQGAIVSINKEYQGKVLRPINKVDFSSLYPNIIYNFNLSPETVSLWGIGEFKEGFFEYKDFDDYYLIEFSDNRMKKNLILKVLKEEGFLPHMMKEFLDERSKIKKLLKVEKGEAKRIELNSKSWCLKVLANSQFGLSGSGFFRYSNIYVAIAITAIGRFLISHIKGKLDGKHIEIDTDGIYVHGGVDSTALTNDLNSFIMEEFKRETKFNLDEDNYKAGFFMKMKNYILLNEKGKLIKHGVSFKASSKNAIFSTALEKIAYSLLAEPDKILSVAQDCYDRIDYEDIDAFVQRTTINRPLIDYTSQPSAGKKGCLQVQVGKQTEAFHESDIRVGDSISYVKVYDGYKIRETVKKQSIDKSYYRKQVVKVLEKFNLQDVLWKVTHKSQTLLMEF